MKTRDNGTVTRVPLLSRYGLMGRDYVRITGRQAPTTSSASRGRRPVIPNLVLESASGYVPLWERDSAPAAGAAPGSEVASELRASRLRDVAPPALAVEHGDARARGARRLRGAPDHAPEALDDASLRDGHGRGERVCDGHDDVPPTGVLNRGTVYPEIEHAFYMRASDGACASTRTHLSTGTTHPPLLVRTSTHAGTRPLTWTRMPPLPLPPVSVNDCAGRVTHSAALSLPTPPPSGSSVMRLRPRRALRIARATRTGLRTGTRSGTYCRQLAQPSRESATFTPPTMRVGRRSVACTRPGEAGGA